MATKKSQRIAIWVIAIVMLTGTIGGFIAMMVAPSNEASDQARFDDESAKYSEQMSEWQGKVDAQSKQLSEKYYPEFSKYSSKVAEFDPSSVKDLASREIKEGDGALIDDEIEFAAYYIGWNPEGKIFDQSINEDSLKAPLAINGLGTASLIEGWKKGMVGMKIGGVRELAIPSDLAYKEQGSGDLIPPNTPLKFIIMAIEKPEEIPQPEPSEYLTREYQRRYGNTN